MNTNLIKHVLGIPFVKRDGTRKTQAQIRDDHTRAREAYIAKISAKRQRENGPALLWPVVLGL